jgi:DNA-binding beta-propeller fold protein YncE
MFATDSLAPRLESAIGVGYDHSKNWGRFSHESGGGTMARRNVGRWLAIFVAGVLFSIADVARAEKRQQLWVTNAYGEDVHVFDVATLELVRRIEVGPNPHGISATSDGTTVHIALEDFRKPEGQLLWLDARTGEITGRLAIGPLPNECECTPDGKWIYVPCNDEQWWVIDGEKREVTTRIRTGGRPHNTLVSADGRRMYLSPMGGLNAVTIVDIAAGHQVLGAIPFDENTRPPAMTTDERLFFEQVDGLMGFQVADIAQRKVVTTVRHAIPADKEAIQSRCHGLAVRPDQQEIWSANVEHNLVHVHELTSGSYQETAAIAMPGRVYWLCFSPDSKFCFVSVRSASQIAVVDCQTRQIARLLSVGREPKRSQVIEVEQP